MRLLFPASCSTAPCAKARLLLSGMITDCPPSVASSRTETGSWIISASPIKRTVPSCVDSFRALASGLFSSALAAAAIRLSGFRFAFGKGGLEIPAEPNRERVLRSARLEIVRDLLAAELRHHRVHQLGMLGGFDQIGFLQPLRGRAGKGAAEGHEQIARVGGDDVVLVDRVFVQGQDRRVRSFLEARDVFHVGHDLPGSEGHAPGVEQFSQSGRTLRRQALRLHRRPIEHAKRIDKRDQLPAAQDKLIERELASPRRSPSDE